MSKSGQAAYRAMYEPMNLTPEERAFVNQPAPAPTDDPLFLALVNAHHWATQRGEMRIEQILNEILNGYGEPAGDTVGP